MSVASAGCMTAIPAPITADAATASGAVVASPNPIAPTAAVTEPVSSTGSGPRRSIVRPVNGSTASAATANADRTTPAVPAPRPRTCAT